MKATIINIIDKKTFKVSCSSYKKHRRYGKYLTVNRNYLVDSDNSEVAVGQEVEIFSSRPISKKKKWLFKINTGNRNDTNAN